MEDHKRPVAEILVNARLASAVGTPPLPFVRLEALPPFSPPPIQVHLDVLVPRKIPAQMVPKVRLVSRHDKQASNPARRLCFERSPLDWHSASPRLVKEILYHRLAAVKVALDPSTPSGLAYAHIRAFKEDQ